MKLRNMIFFNLILQFRDSSNTTVYCFYRLVTLRPWTTEDRMGGGYTYTCTILYTLQQVILPVVFRFITVNHYEMTVVQCQSK